MHRRAFLLSAAASATWPLTSPAVESRYHRALVIVELAGGNDGLNTLVPIADASYRRLRPSLALRREETIALDEHRGLHPSLEPLHALWARRELAVVEGVGYPRPNLSHFRSLDIWHTGSGPEAQLDSGWVARAFAAAPPPATFAADAIALGPAPIGPLSGARARTLVLEDTNRFRRRARWARRRAAAVPGSALAHVLAVEDAVANATRRLDPGPEIDGAFPASPFGRALATAARLVRTTRQAAAFKVTLPGFDTHAGQRPVHARLLAELARGLAAFAEALRAAGRWDDTLVLTTSEFGRRARENGSAGTDHGAASIVFALGGRVHGGFHGKAPRLDGMDGNGNPVHTVDYRRVYATVLERWWQIDSAEVLGRRYEPLELV